MDDAPTTTHRSGTAAPPPHAEYFPPTPAAGRPRWRWLATIAADRRELARAWPVIQNMVAQELRVKYQRSALGFLWTLLNPILMMGTLTIVFSQLMGQEPGQYALYLFAGMLPWGLLASCLSDCSICILANESLIRKVYLPKLVFPLARVLLNLVMLALSMAALYLLMIPFGAKLRPSLVLLPVAIALFTAFATGLGLVLAVLNTFYRDIGHLVSIVVQAWYFATPILYPVSQLSEEMRWRFWLNPAYPFIRLFQVIVHEGAWPDPTLPAVAAALAAASLGIGYAVFKSHEDKLVYRL